MAWFDSFADAIITACGGNYVLLIFAFLLFIVVFILIPTALFVAKLIIGLMKDQDEFLKATFSQQNESTKSIVEAQNASTKAIIEVLKETMDDNHKEVMNEFGRAERHMECIKRTAIETKAVVVSNGSGRA